MTENINAVAGSEGVEYNLTSGDTPLLTMVVNQDGHQRKIIDARASAFSMNGTAGETLNCTAEFIGILAADSDTNVAAVAPVYPTIMPIVVRGATLALTEVGGDAVAGAIETLTVDFGLTTPARKDMAATDGYAAPIIADRNIKITLNPEWENAPDWVGRMRLNKDFDLQATFDSRNAVQNRVSIRAPYCRIMEVADGDREGIRTRDITLMAARGAAGDDEFQIIFT